jgi:integrase
MGTLNNRDGVWHANYVDRQGRRRRISTRTADIKVARARLRELELATTDRAAHPTEALDDALKYFVDVTHAGSPAGTVSSYRQKARHLSRLLGAELADAITRERVERYIAARLGEGAHPHSVHKELVVLRGSLEAARARGRFHGAADVVPRFRAQYTPRTTYLTPDQFAALAEHLVRNPPGPVAPELRRQRWERRRNGRVLYCMLIAFASPRVGELEAMRPAHVDLGRDVLRVPKGKTLGRSIAIHPMLRPWLEWRLGEVAHAQDPLVEPWANVRRDLGRAADRAGVPRVTPNDLRRTFASWLVQGGTPLLVVSRLLGHSSTRMVDLVYGQLDDATLHAAIGRLPGGCDAGVTSAGSQDGTRGAIGTARGVRRSRISDGDRVPRVGIEPTTRGFSGLSSLAPKAAQRRPKLKLCK